jgi:CBS domain-containing protein
MLIDEVMNRQVVSVRPGDPRERVLAAMLEYGVTSVPMLDADQRVVGVVSQRDMVEDGAHAYRISTPAHTLRSGTRLHEAATEMASQSLHHAVVVDAKDRAVGVLSLLDVVRGLLGGSARHPLEFGEFDAELEVYWSPLVRLDLDHLATAPAGPGIVELYDAHVDARARPLWIESTDNVLRCVAEWIARPTRRGERLAALLATDATRFRAAGVVGADRHAHVVRELRSRHPDVAVADDPSRARAAHA